MSDPTIPAGMKPWHGGDSAPADWDGRDTLLRCGISYPGPYHIPASWQHDGSETDIIAYTPALSTPTTPDAPSTEVQSAAPTFHETGSSLNVEATSVVTTLWRNLTDGDLRMARENCACLGFLLRTGRLPKWEELEAAYGEMNALLASRGRA